MVPTSPRGSGAEASLQSPEDTDDPVQQALHVNLREPQKVATACEPDVPTVAVLPINSSSLEGKTTVMVRNVPAKFMQQKLMREINAAGFLGKYDFLYLPMHPGGRGNRGFAFINFTTPESAEAFKLAFGGSRFRHFSNSQPWPSFLQTCKALKKMLNTTLECFGVPPLRAAGSTSQPCATLFQAPATTFERRFRQ